MVSAVANGCSCVVGCDAAVAGGEAGSNRQWIHCRNVQEEVHTKQSGIIFLKAIRAKFMHSICIV